MSRSVVAMLALFLSLFLGGVAVAGPGEAFAQQGNGGGGGMNHEDHIGGRGGTTTPEEPQDLPMKWLYISLGISAVIGAAGGEILVSLLGRRT